MYLLDYVVKVYPSPVGAEVPKQRDLRSGGVVTIVMATEMPDYLVSVPARMRGCPRMKL